MLRFEMYARRRAIAMYAGLACLAYVVRLVPVLTGGGLGFYGRYDDSVYYTAADALTYGRLPYTGFTQLHPPLLLIVLAPFALLGRATRDATGMEVARLFFMALGALNTVMVAKIARRWGTTSAVIAGLMYACWLPAVYGEESTMLEPLGSAALCVALLLLLKRNRPISLAAALFAGSVLGLAVTDKIWYGAPLAAVVLWQLAVREFRTAIRITVGAVVAIAVVITPFAILTGSRMWDMVIRDQLLRPQIDASRFSRLTSVLGLQAFATGQPSWLTILTFIGVVILIVVAVAGWRRPGGRPVVWIFAVNLAVLMASPPYYQHYAAFIAVPGALLVGVVSSGMTRLPRPQMIAGLTATAALIGVSAIAVITSPTGYTFPASFAKAAPSGCVTSDDPQALIDMDRLSRDLRRGCYVPVDVTGITFDRLDDSTRRRLNLPWQNYLVNYLLSGTSFVILRGPYDELTRNARHDLHRPILARTTDVVLRLRLGLGPAGPGSDIPYGGKRIVAPEAIG